MKHTHTDRERQRHSTCFVIGACNVFMRCDDSSECRKRKSGLGVGVGGPANSLLPVTKCKLQDSNSTYNELFVSLSDVHMSRCEINA